MARGSWLVVSRSVVSCYSLLITRYSLLVTCYLLFAFFLAKSQSINQFVSILKKDYKLFFFSFFMLELTLFGIVAFAGGGLWGKKLAKKGVTSDNALLKHQSFFVAFIVTVALIFICLIVIDKFNLASLLPQIIPSIILIYLAGWYHSIIFVSGFFVLGLLLFIELNGKYNHRKIFQLSIALTLISFVLTVLGYYIKPVDKLLEDSKIVHGVVMQTTFYTCAPSAIATLSRQIKKHPQLTEKEAIKYTKTNRFGTTTLREIKAMKQLGLNPQYHHNLTIENLFALNKPALLHVKEKNKDDEGVRFSHAVALLAVNPQSQLLLIGNPYYGLQIKTVHHMENYWFGEAISICPTRTCNIFSK